MLAATFLAMALASGGMPCACCEQDGRPPRQGVCFRHACDGGQCFSCRRPLYGPSAPPFDYRLIYNYPWSQQPCYPPRCPPVAADPADSEPIPAPPADAGSATIHDSDGRGRMSSRVQASASRERRR